MDSDNITETETETETGTESETEEEEDTQPKWANKAAWGSKFSNNGGGGGGFGGGFKKTPTGAFGGGGFSFGGNNNNNNYNNNGGAPAFGNRGFSFGGNPQPVPQPATGFGMPAPAPVQAMSFGGGGFRGGFGGGAGKGGFGTPNRGFQQPDFDTPMTGDSMEGGCSRAEFLNMVNQVERALVPLRLAGDAVHGIERVNSLGFEVATELMRQREVEKNHERRVEKKELETVNSRLAKKNMVSVDSVALNVLRGLQYAKQQRERELIEEQKKIVQEEVAGQERFLQVEFEKKFVVEAEKEKQRDIERRYMQKTVEILKGEIASQRKLILTISKAAMGDFTPDEEQRKKDEAQAQAEAAAQRQHEAKVASMKKRLADAMAATPLRPTTKKFKRIPLNQPKGDKSTTDAPTDLSEDETDVKVATPESKKDRSSALFGLSADVKLPLWNEMKEQSWRKVLLGEAQQPYFTYLNDWLLKQRERVDVFPPQNQVFNAFNLTPLNKVRVVLIGQDPYHDYNQANGLCFSVNDGVKIPPSLKNVFKELKTDIKGWQEPKTGNLEKWAKRGVLMLNSVLTVEAHKPGSHSASGWQNFTEMVIKVLNDRDDPIVFMAWGNYAKKKCQMVNKSKHRVVESAHPSPLSFNRWKNCKVFSRCNTELIELGEDPINWALA